MSWRLSRLSEKLLIGRARLSFIFFRLVAVDRVKVSYLSFCGGLNTRGHQWCMCVCVDAMF